MSSYSRWRKATLRRQRAAFKAASVPIFRSAVDDSGLGSLTAADIIRNMEELRSKLGFGPITGCAAEVFMLDGPEYGGLRFAPRMPMIIMKVVV